MLAGLHKRACESLSNRLVGTVRSPSRWIAMVLMTVVEESDVRKHDPCRLCVVPGVGWTSSSKR